MGGKGSGGRRGNLKKRAAEPLATDRIIYERQPKETDPAWRAFCVYRDDPERSQEKVAKATGKSAQLMAAWSTRWSWRKRVVEWDREADDRSRAAQLDEIEEMQRRHIRLAQGMQQLAAIELKRKLEGAQKKQKLGQLAAKDMRELIEAGAKLERLNRGEPTDYVKTDAVQVITVGGKPIKF